MKGANLMKLPRRNLTRRADRTEFDRLKNGFLDTAQASAADRFETLYIRAQSCGGGIDPTRERVNGGKGYYEIPDSVIECQQQLAQAARLVGILSYAIVHKFVCEGMTAAQIARQFGEKGERAERYYRKRFRDTLDELAEAWFGAKERRRRAYYLRGDVAGAHRTTETTC